MKRILLLLSLSVFLCEGQDYQKHLVSPNFLLPANPFFMSDAQLFMIDRLIDTCQGADTIKHEARLLVWCERNKWLYSIAQDHPVHWWLRHYGLLNKNGDRLHYDLVTAIECYRSLFQQK